MRHVDLANQHILPLYITVVFSGCCDTQVGPGSLSLSVPQVDPYEEGQSKRITRNHDWRHWIGLVLLNPISELLVKYANQFTFCLSISVGFFITIFQGIESGTMVYTSYTFYLVPIKTPTY